MRIRMILDDPYVNDILLLIIRTNNFIDHAILSIQMQISLRI
jgi:hypothetical protein